MKTLTFFNNKGGVGKTTLTANIAAFVALEKKKRVLVVDCDPQCNLTQHILGDEKTIDMYWIKNKSNRFKTIMDVVAPIIVGDSTVDHSIKPMMAKTNRFGVDLLPGDLKFSAFEDNLSTAWSDGLSGKPGGFRVTKWLSAYLESVHNNYDYAFIDVSPSLGPLNRSVMISSNYFITPLGADAFSLLGIRNISQWINSWVDQYNMAIDNSEKFYPSVLNKFGVTKNLPITSGFVGYTLQQYIAKSVGGQKRPTKAYEKILNDVPSEVHDHLLKYSVKPNSETHLGDVPNLYSLIPLSQKNNAPIISLKTKDGLVGSQFSQVSSYRDLIEHLANRIIERTP